MRPKGPRMNRATLLVLPLAVALAGGAIARDRPPGPPSAGGFGPGRLFISPAGEPFRGPDGLRRWFEAADTDRDGALTLTEFRSDFMRFFKILDTDGDGRVDGVENQAYEASVVPEITRLACPAKARVPAPSPAARDRLAADEAGGRGANEAVGPGTARLSWRARPASPCSTSPSPSAAPTPISTGRSPPPSGRKPRPSVSPCSTPTGTAASPSRPCRPSPGVGAALTKTRTTSSRAASDAREKHRRFHGV